MLRFLVFFVFGFFLNAQEAHAYLDPGTGSYVLQLLIAGVLGASFAIKMSWRRIKAFMAQRFAGRRTKGSDD